MPRPTPSTAAHSALLGYAALHHAFQLHCPAPRVNCRLSTAVTEIVRTRHFDGTEDVLYRASRYGKFAESPAGQLEFALRYEPLDLCLLATFFLGEASRASARAAIEAMLAASPLSQYARVAGHLYEWLTGEVLAYRLPAGAKRVALLGPQAYFTGPEVRDPRWGVVHNLIGTRRLTPIVRRTPLLAQMNAQSLRERLVHLLEAVDPGILDRALTYLYLAETRSSFALEREVPDQEKRELFRRLLEQAGEPGRLTEDAMVTWQHAVIPQALAQEHAYRGWQNWLSKPGLRAVVDFIPPAPADVHELMEGVADIAKQAAAGDVDPVIGATCASFAMVFVHPFGDGNGRLHRFLLHHVLRQSGVTPRGVVLPVSVALEANVAEYAAALTHYSRPRTRLLEHRLDVDANPPRIEVRSPQPAQLYSFFDATEACELIVRSIERALTQDLPRELAWLRAYDTAMARLNAWLNGPQPQIDLLVRLVVQNGGRLSKGKRSKFERFTDGEIERAEREIAEAFAEWQASFGSASPQNI